jgi:hypothetical protein
MEVISLTQDITLKSLSKKQVLDMKPGELKVKAKDKNEWKHGIGAILTSNIGTSKKNQ